MKALVLKHRERIGVVFVLMATLGVGDLIVKANHALRGFGYPGVEMPLWFTVLLACVGGAGIYFLGFRRGAKY